MRCLLSFSPLLARLSVSYLEGPFLRTFPEKRAPLDAVTDGFRPVIDALLYGFRSLDSVELRERFGVPVEEVKVPKIG